MNLPLILEELRGVLPYVKDDVRNTIARNVARLEVALIDQVEAQLPGPDETPVIEAHEDTELAASVR